MQAVVLAGGKGTRLAGRAEAPPKALVPLAGLPAIDHVIGWLAHEGVTDVVLCVGHRAEEILDVVGDGGRFGLRVRARREASPLGTAGAVRAALADLEETFFVVYADVIAAVDLGRMRARHEEKRATATLAVHPSDHPHDSDRVLADREGRIVRIAGKGAKLGPEAGSLTSAALYVVERALVASLPEGEADFARDVFPRLAEGGRLYAYRTTEYLKDMGTPERRERVESDLREDRPARMRRSALRPAILTDRDGVLIVDAPLVTRPEQIELLPRVALALHQANRRGYLTVCCTNQPVVARGDLSLDGLHALHDLLEGKLGEHGAWLDAIYVCPHHPHRGFPGERADLKVSCDCRKPLPGMLSRAAGDLGIDRAASVFVGDRTIDLRAARAAGVLGIGVLTGTALTDGKAAIAPETPIVADFADAVRLPLETAPSWEPMLDEVRRARVVLLGGCSRSGKTVAASALALALRSRGTPALHVSLDRFIRPLALRRAGGSLGERTGLEGAKECVAQLLTHLPALVPSYDPLRRAQGPSEVLVYGEGVLIVEGIWAASLDVPSGDVPPLKLEMVAERDALRGRRRMFYAWKGLSGRDIEEVLDERDDEDRELGEIITHPRRRLRIDDRGRVVAA